MRDIIPFKKDVIFKTNISEITSISLENTLSINKDVVSGEFLISGEYKASDKSTTVEPFEIKLPFEIVIDDRYDSKNAIVDIDDFYYEIVNDNVLSISIDVLIDKLKDKPVVELDDLVDVKREVEILNDNDRICDDMEDNVEENILHIIDTSEDDIKEKEEVVVEKTSDSEEIKSLFNQFNNDSDVYVTYNVFIVREGDNIDSILDNYGVTLDELKEYNDISDLKIGDKIIIPSKYEGNK